MLNLATSLCSTLFIKYLASLAHSLLDFYLQWSIFSFSSEEDLTHLNLKFHYNRPEQEPALYILGASRAPGKACADTQSHLSPFGKVLGAITQKPILSEPFLWVQHAHVHRGGDMASHLLIILSSFGSRALRLWFSAFSIRVA